MSARTKTAITCAILLMTIFLSTTISFGQNSGSDHFLPLVLSNFSPANAPCSPTIVLDSVPAYGGQEDLKGHVICAAPESYKIAVYIFVSGWWTKPYFASPLTPIVSDGAWTTDITTGGSDPYATEIAAFLVPIGYNPPLMSGGAVLPEELFMNATANSSVTRRAARTIEFSGFTWEVKFTPVPAGPGPNYFSDDPADVWVDENGSLHLSIVNRSGTWYSTEVICTQPLQHGTYTFTLGSRADLLDKNAVLGFFSWDTNAPQYNYREIDIEFSRWGEDSPLNAQYVVQPWDVSGNRYRFSIDLAGAESVHRFDWRDGRVQFDSWGESGTPLQSWSYSNTAYIPPAGAGNARINLWLLNGWAPSDGQNIEVVVKSFQFTPADP